MKKLLNIRTPAALQKFMKLESASGLIMLGAMALALLMANTPLDNFYKALLSFQLPFGFQVRTFVKDILMVGFFFLIGMELKKEVVEGFLSKKEQILLPLVTAVAGMAVPALIYNFFNHNILATRTGWAIPSATDIAFALCVLNIFGQRILPAVKIFLLAVAIFDDLGAIVIIALFYGEGAHFLFLFLSALVMAGMFFLNRREFPAIWPYIICGVLLVFLLDHAGIHTTIAGVITAFFIPLKAGRKTPLKTLMKEFQPWVSYFILPLFAFVAAGVSFINFDSSLLFSPITLGITLGLFIGKQIGIFGAAYALIKFKAVSMPQGAGWKDIYIVSILSGIGFTMSLFISQLAFVDPVFQEEAKIGILAGSLLSAVLGAFLLKKDQK